MRNGPNIRADNEPLFTRFQIFPVDNQTENPLEIRDTVGNLLWSVGPTGLPSVPQVQFNVRDGLYGALGNGTTDDTQAIQAAMDAAAAAGGGTVLFPPGTYVVAGQLSLTTGNAIALLGEPGAILDGTTSIAATLITLGGQRLSSAVLTQGSAAGSLAIETALPVVAGDVLLLSTDTYAGANPGDTSVLFVPSQPTDYRGELVEVASVSGTTVTLKSPIYDTYTAAKTKAYALQLPRITLQGLDIRRNSDQAGLWVRYGRDVVISRCRITGARERAFYVQYCFGAFLSDNDATDFSYSGTGTSYGIVIGSSQHVLTSGNRLFGGRHAISHGGNEPYRDCLVLGNVLDCARINNQAALDFHPNGEYLIAQSNVIKGGIGSSARNVQIEGNRVQAETQHGIYLQPQLSGDYLICRNNVITSGIVSDYYGIAVSPAAASLTYGQLDVSHNTLRNVASGIRIEITNASFTGWVLNHVSLIGNDVVAAGLDALLINTTGGATIQIGRLCLLGGRYQATTQRAALITTLTSPGSATLRDAYFIAGLAGARCVQFANLADAVIAGCTFEGTPSGALSLSCRFDATGQVALRDNRFVNFSANSGIDLTSGTYSVEDNLFSNTSGSPSLGSGKQYSKSRGATVVVDGGSITHNLRTTPSSVRVTPSVAGEFASVTAISSTAFVVALRTHTGSTGTSQTVYWQADV